MRFPPRWEGAGQEGELSPQPPGGDAAPRAGPAGPRPLRLPPPPPPAGQHRAPGMVPLVPVLPLKTGTLFPEWPQSTARLLLLPSKNLSL